MNSKTMVIFAALLLALAVMQAESSDIVLKNDAKISICTPEAFEWLINHCPTRSAARRAIRRLERGDSEGAYNDIGMRRILRSIGDCCGVPGCSDSELLTYC
ncbi:hypothetical protein TrispH2_004495 [Trichoplax sp. H2]|nr:hypothetical protein TrispH2_004495 [Trichoplax sp. H2]|eukprot:RDD43300.1 hypothetical protein TrispH2_004495 [Trichoplax sp. H2]